MAYAYPYILLLLTFAILAIVNKYYEYAKEKQIAINIIALLIYIFFFGFRGFVAYDWTAYFNVFSNIPDLHTFFKENTSRFKIEPGFLLLVATCKTIMPSYLFFQLTCTIINTTLLTRFIKRYTNNIPAVLVIFICMAGLELSIDLMRNSLSIFIFLNAIPFIEKKQPVRYFIICALAASFHTSALIYIPAYFILNKKLNKRFFLIVFIIANIICVFRIPIIKTIIMFSTNLISPTTAQYINAYMSFDSEGSPLGIGYLEKLFTGIMLFCYMDKLKALRKNYILINSMFLYIILNLFLGEFRTISIRCSNLFAFAYWIVWLDLLKCFYYKSNKVIYFIILCMYCILKIYSGCSGSMSQYYNVLLEEQSHNERFIYFRQHQNDKK